MCHGDSKSANNETNTEKETQTCIKKNREYKAVCIKKFARMVAMLLSFKNGKK